VVSFDNWPSKGGDEMSQLFRASELIELAILIEKNGEEFYSSLRDSARTESLREVFSYLAGEEKRHLSIFKKLLGPLRRYEQRESYPGEYQAYMKAVADSHVFIKKDVGEDLAKKAGKPIQAIDLALGFEKDTILFFDAMSHFIPAAEQETVGQLTNEERKHIVRLRGLRDTMGKED